MPVHSLICRGNYCDLPSQHGPRCLTLPHGFSGSSGKQSASSLGFQ
jgi:hypothetical protein